MNTGLAYGEVFHASTHRDIIVMPARREAICPYSGLISEVWKLSARELLNRCLKTVASILLLFALPVNAIGWTPLNLLLGPQYQAHTHNKMDSISIFLKNTVPILYPKLIQCLRRDGASTMHWVGRYGDTQRQVINLSDGTVTIDTDVFVGKSPEDAKTSTKTVRVIMTDVDRDGQMDEITYLDGSSHHSYKRPFDKASNFLWISSIAIAFKYSQCFKQK